MKNLNASASFQIPGGPTLSATASLEIEAYDRIDVTLKPGDSDKTVDIQPGAASQLRLLVIKSSLYDAGGDLTYVVSDGLAINPNDSDPVNLDAPQIFMGVGAVGLFGIDPPKSVKFTNGLASAGPSDTSKDAYIEILVGRDATPS
jgi:hypothetical protein